MLMAAVNLMVDGGAVPTPNVAKRTQPVSVPTPGAGLPTTIQPFMLGDPRYNSAFLADNAYVASLNSFQGPGIAPLPGYDPAIAAAMTAMRQATYGLYNTPTTNTETPPAIVVTPDTTQPPAPPPPPPPPPAYTPTIEIPAGNNSFAPTGTSDTVTSDASSIPQPQAAIPQPVYALDTPSNLYIDVNSFVKNSDGTYTASLTFDPVQGAVSGYKYRISATS